MNNTALLGAPSLLALALMTGCATLPDNTDRPSSFALPTEQPTTLQRTFQEPLQKHSGLSGFHLLGDGLDSFATRTMLAHAAEKTIDAHITS